MSARIPTTPIRAITSPLVTRSSLSIPPSTQVSEPFVRSVLRFRLIYGVFLYSAALSWVHAIAWNMWGQGGFSKLGIAGACLLVFRPLTLMTAFITWITVGLPVAVLRKLFLTSTRTLATSPSSSVKAAISKNGTTHTFITYMLSALAALALHIGLAYTNEYEIRGNPRLTVFVNSRKHPHYLNGRLVFLLVVQISLALGFSLRNIMLDRFVFRWSPSLNRKRPWGAIDVIKTLMVAVLFTSLAFPVSMLVFGLIRLTLPILYKIPILPIFLRPFTAHFLRGSWTIFLPFRHVSLLVRGWSLGVTTTFIWESSNALFDALIPQPISISHLTPDPNATLVSGLSSADGTFRYFAYSELKELATDTSASGTTRRSALFSDQKYNPNLWARLVRESLILLGEDYQLLLRRGKPLVAKPVAAPPKVLPPINPDIATPVALLRKPIYQSSQQSPIRNVIESLGSDGPFAQALDAGAEAANIPELFKSVEAAVLPSPAKEEVKVKESTETTSGIFTRIRNEMRVVVLDHLEKLIPTWAADAGTGFWTWWTTERINKVVEQCLPNKEIDVVVVDVLSHLTCASLAEDKYGVVQRDIPKILEAMLSLLSVVEEYQVEITSLYTPPPLDQNLTKLEIDKREAIKAEVDKAVDILRFVGDGLKEGVSRIVRTFGDKLLAFKFPPRTAQKLQGFLEYC